MYLFFGNLGLDGSGGGHVGEVADLEMLVEGDMSRPDLEYPGWMDNSGGQTRLTVR